jgi:hypothetical protein
MDGSDPPQPVLTYKSETHLRRRRSPMSHQPTDRLAAFDSFSSI